MQHPRGKEGSEQAGGGYERESTLNRGSGEGDRCVCRDSAEEHLKLENV